LNKVLPIFNHFDLKIVKPEFESDLTGLIISLDALRNKRLEGSTHPSVFFQLKHIFQTLESIGSARIEGNNTTIAEYIETKLENKRHVAKSGQTDPRHSEQTDPYLFGAN
jgi:hypothetical protein